ncbi:MAG: 16S rRNA (adenine(1518)-N(6)/adenine(1519)-N(6))-dimethyltransferase RsmA [Pseudomonadota bacterium]|nr:16S rRNA (adenine(1518)-N(6)/adenine(1519)-N(6))-dimethyltransferase RsmA [Pseudomonadota bacterium]
MGTHIPRKRFGQHFLVDQGVLQQIVDAISPRDGDHLVEIGPGLGALTQPLLARIRHLTAIELDRDVVVRLRQRFGPERLTLHEADALAFDFASLGPAMRLVGNLPYNISTPLLFRFADLATQLVDGHFMLQKEVVDRMVATPGTTDYSRLSVLLQWHFHLETLFDVPPEAFDPPPKVMSAVVRLIPRPADARPDVAEADLRRVLAAAFAQRRKMLRGNLRPLFTPAQLEALDVAPTARAEELTLEDYARLARALPKA